MLHQIKAPQFYTDFRSSKTLLNPPVNGKIQGLFEAFECFSSTFQGKFIFQGHFKTVLYIQELFKPVRTLLNWWIFPYILMLRGCVYLRGHIKDIPNYDVLLSRKTACTYQDKTPNFAGFHLRIHCLQKYWITCFSIKLVKTDGTKQLKQVWKISTHCF